MPQPHTRPLGPLFVALCAAGLVSCKQPEAPPKPASPWATLQARHPQVLWNTKLERIADIDCDGKPDRITVGRSGDKEAWIGVLPAAGDPIAASFGIGAGYQDQFCAVPVRIDLEERDCLDDDGALPGCKVIKGCQAFVVADDECDSFRFYWNDADKRLDWWRR